MTGAPKAEIDRMKGLASFAIDLFNIGHDFKEIAKKYPTHNGVVNKVTEIVSMLHLPEAEARRLIDLGISIAENRNAAEIEKELLIAATDIFKSIWSNFYDPQGGLKTEWK